jgi:phosphoadenosine phosphosulfate reductase
MSRAALALAAGFEAEPVAELAQLNGAELIAALLNAYPGRVAVSSSFGAESAVLLALVADVDPALPVLTLDTGRLFAQTIAYRELLVERLGLQDVRVAQPLLREIAEQDPEGDLWFTDPDACCQLRKVRPMGEAARDFDVLIDGRKRFHGEERRHLPTVEWAGRILKAAPLANWTAQQIEQAFKERDLPSHPLLACGYRSIGCEPCTSPVADGEPVRSGRWAGSAKTECGLHKPAWF